MKEDFKEENSKHKGLPAKFEEFSGLVFLKGLLTIPPPS